MSDFRKEVRYKNGKFNFLLHGDRGTIVFVVSTGWEWANHPRFGDGGRTIRADLYPNSHGVDHHARFEIEWATHNDNCLWLGGAECWFDGSGLAGDDLLKTLIEDGDEAVWPKLQEFYESWIVKNDPNTKTATTA